MKTDVPRDEEYLTIDQVAQRLQIPRNTIYKWRSRSNPVPALRVGKHLRFRLSDVVEWLVQGEAGGSVVPRDQRRVSHPVGKLSVGGA